jgi:predicted DNA-binding protein YlxM (UPF0122 family)
VNLVASEGRRDDASVAKVAETYDVFKQQIHDMRLSCERYKKYDVAIYDIAKKYDRVKEAEETVVKSMTTNTNTLDLHA